MRTRPTVAATYIPQESVEPSMADCMVLKQRPASGDQPPSLGTNGDPHVEAMDVVCHHRYGRVTVGPQRDLGSHTQTTGKPQS